jgi:phosphoribosyl 1,2-cyclic phosphodiesterase
LLVDNDAGLLHIRRLRLLSEGYDVKILAGGACAFTLEAIAAYAPDLIVLDFVVPNMPGSGLLGRIRRDGRFGSVKIIVNSAVGPEGNTRYCLESGADAFLSKPIGHEALAETIRSLLDDDLTVRFWGTRGGIARAGHNTAKFGGNTLCVTVELSKDRLFIFDAGSGMVNFGQSLAPQRKHLRFNLFISHPYWDHIQGLPFFEPLQIPGNEMVVHGAAGHDRSLREAIDGQRKNPYFPVIARDCSARVDFRELHEGDYEIDQLQLSAIALNHPGPALGYRLTSPAGKTVAYITDNEVCTNGDALGCRKRLTAFLKDADILIHDATYFDNEYPGRVGSGHSAVSAVLKLAGEASVKRLYLFHHDPSHDDESIARKEMIARYYFDQSGLGVECWAAREGTAITI